MSNREQEAKRAFMQAKFNLAQQENQVTSLTAKVEELR